MKIIQLSKEQILTLRTLHRTTKDRKKADRIKTVLFLNRWFSLKETAELLLLDEETIKTIQDRFINEWIEEFLKDGYVNYAWKLNDEQKEKVRVFVRNNTILDSIIVIEFIKNNFDILYTRSWVASLLHSLKFVYKKTKLVPSKSKIISQILHIYKYTVLKILKQDNEIFYFIDGVHPLHNAISSYGWIEKGQEKQIKANTGRERVNINWAYCLDTQDVICVFSESVNAQSTIELYKKMEEKHPEMQTIYVVGDNARYYANKEVQEYLKNSRIIEIPLPPYSPNLNPIERLWLFMKKNILYSTYYEHFFQFKEAISMFFNENFYLHRDKLKNFITDNFRAFGF